MKGPIKTMVVKVVIPVYNPDGKFSALLDAYKQQTIYQDLELLVINSGTTNWFEKQMDYRKMRLLNISANNFDHGATRQQGVDYFDKFISDDIVSDNINHTEHVVVFLTQDAILATNDSIERLVSSFVDSSVGAAFGRQLPHSDASEVAAYSRFYNYKDVSYKYSYKDRKQHGIKTAFFSNSFSAYRVKYLRAVGRFPVKTIFGEDMLIAAKLLKKGCKIAYVAEAIVYHSHNYTIKTEFERAFDTGVFHAVEPWLLEDFGKAEGEGVRFVKSELAYVGKRKPIKIADCIVRNGTKFLGYKLGRLYRYLPKSLVIKFSMNKNFWK